MFDLKQSETRLGTDAKAVTWGMFQRGKESWQIRLRVKNLARA